MEHSEGSVEHSGGPVEHAGGVAPSPTHADLAAGIPTAPPDADNDAIIFAKKTLRWTLILTLLFVGIAVYWTFRGQT